MQFFYIDYMNGNKKERNIGFLRADKAGLHVGLHGVPAQCGGICSVYALNHIGERRLLGTVPVKNGYGMEKLGWTREVGFEDCVGVEIPLYGARLGRCIIREAVASQIERAPQPEQFPRSEETSQPGRLPRTEEIHRGEETSRGERSLQREESLRIKDASSAQEALQSGQKLIYGVNAGEEEGYRRPIEEEIVAESIPDKWSQLVHTYPQVHILPEAQSILIKPRDIIILTEKYHDLATNSFVLHAYYNYRQLLLFNYMQGEMGAAAYYIGVPGVYYERECRIAEMFGFEGFENGEARMREEGERENALYKGCFGYYMKQVEI